jgi:hypothetical protein
MEFCLDLLRSKLWLIGEWSIILVVSANTSSTLSVGDNPYWTSTKNSSEIIEL